MNRKNIILFLLTLTISFNQLQAQEENKVEIKEEAPAVERQTPTGYITLNAGLATATGNFAKKTIGSALSGQTFQLAICAPFENSYFGLATKVNYSTYSMSDETFYRQQMAINKEFKLDTTVKFKSNIGQNYVQTTFLVGMYGTVPILSDDRLSIDARVLFGPTFINRPALAIDSIGGKNFTETYTQAASKSSSFAYDFGVSIRYNLLKSRKLCLMLSYDFIKTNGDFTFEANSKYKNDSDVLQEGIHTERQKFTMSAYDITAGIGYVW